MGKAPDNDQNFNTPVPGPSVNLGATKAPITPLAQRNLGAPGGGMTRMPARSFAMEKSPMALSQGGGGDRMSAVLNLLGGSA